MNRILTLQRRTVIVGRLRIGAKGANGAPIKLTKFRFTSRDGYAIREAARLYGGEAKHWEGAPTDDQWEVYTEQPEIEVTVPPGPQAISQYFELWSGGGCQRRCDGITEQLSDRPCICGPDLDKKACKPTTRLNVILPDVPGLGAWLLTSGGWNAAHELAVTAELLAAVTAAQVSVPAVLRLEQRKSVQGGKTKHYVVPVLALQSTMRELQGLREGTMQLPAPMPGARAAIEAGRAEVVAVPAIESAAKPSTPTASGPPETAQDLARIVEACTKRSDLSGYLAAYANKMHWMDDQFVASKYSPTDNVLISLREVFRDRDAELESDDDV